jgi:hypothetical protein
MSAPTINANAAIFFRILLMIGCFSCLSSSVKPKQSTLVRLSTYLLKQLKNSCSQIGSFGYISTTCRGVCVISRGTERFCLSEITGQSSGQKTKDKKTTIKHKANGEEKEA